MSEEGEAESGVTADAIQTLISYGGEFGDAVAAQVGEFGRFEVAPHLFYRIQLRCVAR